MDVQPDRSSLLDSRVVWEWLETINPIVGLIFHHITDERLRSHARRIAYL